VARGLTQKELAEPEYTHAYVSTIEAGRRQPSKAALRYFSRKLGVKEEELLTGRPPGLESELRFRLQEARRAASAGRLDEAEAAFNRLLREARKFKLVRLQAAAIHGKALCAMYRDDLEAAIEMFDQAEDLLSSQPVTARVETIVGKARCFRRLGDVRYAAYLLESTLERLERGRLAEPSALFRVHASLVFPYIELGADREAAASASKALELASHAGDPEQLGDMHMNVARVFLEEGRVEDAQESLRLAEEAYAQLELQTEIAQCGLARGIVLGREGKLEGARDQLSRARAVFIETASRLDEARATNELARVDRLSGRVDEARELLEKSIRLLGGDSDTAALGWAYREIAFCHEASDPPRAEKNFRLAIEQFERSEDVKYLVTTYRSLGNLLAQQGNISAACEAYRTGIMALEEPL
jgi:tetratricopeptide (TPR) repeat protein